MTDMNQSFIRAFAKKEATTKPTSTMMASEKKLSRRSMAATQSTELENAVTAPSPLKPAGTAASLATLLNSESVLVFSSYSSEPSLGAIAAPIAKSQWTSEAAEA